MKLPGGALRPELPSRQELPPDSAGGPISVRLRLESRLPVPLRRESAVLEFGAWRSAPPEEVGAYSVAHWSASPGGVLGRLGVRGVVRYSCAWDGRKATLRIAFETPLFGERRIDCREEAANGGCCQREEGLLCVQTRLGDGGLKANCAVRLVVELREQVERHVAMSLSRGLTSCSVAAGLREGRLAQVLQQATRSCLIRITNLTRHRLVLDSELPGVEGFWIAEPAECIDSLGFHDLGITSHGLHLSTRGSLTYALESPQTTEEKRVRIRVDWSVPWMGNRHLEAKDTSGLYVVTALSDKQHNLVGTVHVVDQQELPALEVVDAVALARQPGSGADFTTLLRQQMASPYELAVPSVRVLLGRLRRAPQEEEHKEAEPAAEEGGECGEDGEASEDWAGGGASGSKRRDPSKEGAAGQGPPPAAAAAAAGPGSPDVLVSLQVSYRIGPEVFRKAAFPNERLHLSSAMPGGDGRVETALTALEAVGPPEEPAPAPVPEVNAAAERVLQCQRRLASALSPIVFQALATLPGDQLDGLVAPHDLWRTGGRGDCGFQGDGSGVVAIADLQGVELDAESLLRVLRRRWRPIADHAGVQLEQQRAEELLALIERLVVAWAEQGEVDEGTVKRAVTASAELLRAFGRKDAASEMEALRSRAAHRDHDWLHRRAAARDDVTRRSI